MTKQTILVTGGAGYIGSHVCAALQGAGFTPVVYDDFSTGFRQLVQFGPSVEGSVLQASHLAQTIQHHQPIAIVHMAAKLLVAESVARPDLYYHTNVMGGLVVAQAAQAAGIPMVFSSTAAVYGIPSSSAPITEDTPTNPINPYGSSKRMVEQILADMHTAYGLRSVSLRYFNAAGGSATIGYMLPPTHIIPRAVESLLGTQPPLSVMGADYPTPDGTAVRDYLHVADLAQAHVAALHYLLSGGPTLVANVGTGQGVSVRELLTTIQQTLGQPVPHHVGPRRAGDPPMLVANPQRANTVLQWQPRHTLAEMISSHHAFRTRPVSLG
jgi:UDP-arabinose 4-epimerase